MGPPPRAVHGDVVLDRHVASLRCPCAQAVRSYMGARPGEGKAPSEALLDTPEGDIALIFSEQVQSARCWRDA